MTPLEFDQLAQKFGMLVTEGGRHRKAELYYAGTCVVRTLRSRSPREFTHHKVRTQLRLSESQLRAAIRCTLTLEDYIDILKDKGAITE